MPTRIHIVSIQPERDKQGQIEVKITAGSDSTDKGVELLQNLEKSRYFRNPVLRTVSNNPPNGQQGPQGPDIVKFELDAYYIPHLPEKVKAPHESKPATGNASVANHPAMPGRRKKPAVGPNPFTGQRPPTPRARGGTGE